jgi:multicomponent Na+:H+ antiporter subunit E
LGKVLSYIAVYALVYGFYVVFAGATTAFSLVLGAVGSLLVSVIVKPMIISRELVPADIKKLGYLIYYYIYYMAVAEVKAHLEIARIVLSRKLRIAPAIVEVPYHVSTSYGMTLIAGSITNTPGTVVVQVDTGKKVLYIHWLVATTFEPEKARESISADFEKFAQRIFG